MSYLQESKARLEELLERLGVEDHEGRSEVVRYVGERILESYRNGQKACPKCNPRERGRQRAPSKSENPQARR